jgi:hypothetical protein
MFDKLEREIYKKEIGKEVMGKGKSHDERLLLEERKY